MIGALQSLGIDVAAEWSELQLRIQGCGGRIPNHSADLFMGNSGTSMRFLTPLCALGDGVFRLDGIPRMRQRPIGDLVDALNQLGCQVKSDDGFPPVTVAASGLKGGHAVIDCSKSSQFLSGILMSLPYAKDFTVLEAAGEIVSLPYIKMTCQVMNQFGVEVIQLSELGEYSVDNSQSYAGQHYQIEPDASAASYFWAAAAIAGGGVKILGLQLGDIQGDVRFAQVLEEMGCDLEQDDAGITVIGPAKSGIEIDMNDISDTVQTLAAVALCVEGPTTIRGVAHIRHKETDRIGHLALELRKLGATVEELADGLVIIPGKLRPANIETYNDHRMAMALSLVGLKQPGVVIDDPDCTGKTYPDFFRDLKRVTHPGS